MQQISTSFLFNSTLILLGFVWCGVTFARLVCVHRARESALSGAHFSDRCVVTAAHTYGSYNTIGFEFGHGEMS